MDPITLALLTSAISAAGSAAGGLFGRGKGSQPQETQLGRTKRELVDQLLASLKGEGPYSDLFKMDQDTFQKSFVDPSKALFNNQIAPQIQQQYIATGQQNGTGLQDTLTRAGVDLDNMLNQYYAGFQENALNRKSDWINRILGQSEYETQGTPGQSTGSAITQGLGGYFGGSGFSSDITNILDAIKNKSKNTVNTPDNRMGFESI